MFKLAITARKTPSGKTEVLYAGEDASEAIDAYRSATKPGEYVCQRIFSPDRRKSIKGDPAPAASAASKKPRRKPSS